jgi:alpha-tubulin suppressor-like RCC1 family protein
VRVPHTCSDAPQRSYDSTRLGCFVPIDRVRVGPSVNDGRPIVRRAPRDRATNTGEYTMAARGWMIARTEVRLAIAGALLWSCSSDTHAPSTSDVTQPRAALDRHNGGVGTNGGHCGDAGAPEPVTAPATCAVSLSATSGCGAADHNQGQGGQVSTTLPYPIAFELPATIPASVGSGQVGTARLGLTFGDGQSRVDCGYVLHGGSEFNLVSCSNGDHAGTTEHGSTFDLDIDADGSCDQAGDWNPHGKANAFQVDLTLGQPGAAACTAFSVATGGEHTCSVRAGGTVMCAGYNNHGQLGDGTTTTRYEPVTAPGVSGAVQVTAGGLHSCALTSSHQVYCWGENASGELGDGTTRDRSTPELVRDLGPAISIAAGLDRTCALLTDGSVSCWGDNTDGALGDGTTERRLTPVTVRGLNDTVAVAAGLDHTCALLASHEVECWGNNAHGALGDGTTQTRLTPVLVPGLSDVRAIAAGNQYSCALHSAGTASCWGFNADGDLGDGTTTDSLVPVAVQGLNGAVGIAAGLQHTCAVLASGGVSCWGDNANGDLGVGTTTEQLVPTPVVGLTDVQLVAAGTDHTCAVQSGNSVYCWGDNIDGDLGDGTGTFKTVPVLDYSFPYAEVDITGQLLNVFLVYPDPYQTTLIEHTPDPIHTPLLNLAMTTPIPGVGTSLNSTPLNAIFDNFWSVTIPSGSTTTLQQQSVATITQLVYTAIQSNGHGCTDVTVSTPSTGRLGAIAGMSGQPPLPEMVLTYALTGVQVNFTSDYQTTFNVTFDVQMTLSTSYSTLPCSFNLNPTFAQVEDVVINPTNVTAQVATGLIDAYTQYIANQPGNIFQSAIGQANGQTNTVDVKPIATLLGQFSSICAEEEVPDGFSQFLISVPFDTSPLTWTMTHPADAAPVAYDISSQSGIIGLAGASIATSTVQVQPGADVSLAGSGYPPNQATAIDLGWSDTILGGTVLERSDIQWGIGSPTTFLLIENVTGNLSQVFTNLQPNTTYAFEVSECDQITCTPYSQVLDVTTTGAASAVDIALDAISNVLQTVPVDPLGNLSTTITIPISTAPGPHTIMAVVDGTEVASVAIFVSGMGAQPFIEIFDDGAEVSTSNSTFPGLVMDFDTITVNGYGFPVGDTVAITLDGTGSDLGSGATVQPDQTFTAAFVMYAPNNGDYTIVASTQSATASAPVDVTRLQ